MDDNKPYDRRVSIQQRIDDIKAKIEKLSARAKRLEEVKEAWERLEFKEGDVAFHKEYGNVLIKSIEYGNTEEEIDVIKYNVITCFNGTQKVSFTDVVEINENTKVLYGR